MTTTERKFFFFAACGVNEKPGFTRRGLRFEKQVWRPIELGNRDDYEAEPPMVGPETFAALKKETERHEIPRIDRGYGMPTHAPAMLMMRAADPEEVRRHLEEKKALEPQTPVEELQSEIARLHSSKKDLETRLMKLELANGGKGVDAKTEGAQPAQSGDKPPKANK